MTANALVRFAAIAAKIKYDSLHLDLRVDVGVDMPGEHYFLRVASDDGICNDTGKHLTWSGRKWRLSPHMTDGEVVQTAFLAIMTALEHEAREQFTYKGQRVFGPHLDIDKWADYLAHNEMEKERVHVPTT